MFKCLVNRHETWLIGVGCKRWLGSLVHMLWPSFEGSVLPGFAVSALFPKPPSTLEIFPNQCNVAGYPANIIDSGVTRNVVVVWFSSVLTIAHKASGPSQLLIVVRVVLGTVVAFCDVDWGMGSLSASGWYPPASFHEHWICFCSGTVFEVSLETGRIDCKPLYDLWRFSNTGEMTNILRDWVEQV
jgi:hypothetical protein